MRARSARLRAARPGANRHRDTSRNLRKAAEFNGPKVKQSSRRDRGNRECWKCFGARRSGMGPVGASPCRPAEPLMRCTEQVGHTKMLGQMPGAGQGMIPSLQEASIHDGPAFAGKSLAKGIPTCFALEGRAEANSRQTGQRRVQEIRVLVRFRTVDIGRTANFRPSGIDARRRSGQGLSQFRARNHLPVGDTAGSE